MYRIRSAAGRGPRATERTPAACHRRHPRTDPASHQRIWGPDPWTKGGPVHQRVGQEVGASVVVVHPPFRWQKVMPRPSWRGRRAKSTSGISIAVEIGILAGPPARVLAYLPHRTRPAAVPACHARSRRRPPARTRGDDARTGVRLTHLHPAGGLGGPDGRAPRAGSGEPAMCRGREHWWLTRSPVPVVVEVAPNDSTPTPGR